MYSLYFNKRETSLKIEKDKKVFMTNKVTEEVCKYNDCYYLCSIRKPLKVLAEQIKAKWIEEAEQNLQKLKDMKI